MTTIKALSTISYNSEDFLKGKLNELCANGYIDFWYYIKHIGEYDVASNTADKDHIHVYLNLVGVLIRLIYKLCSLNIQIMISISCH